VIDPALLVPSPHWTVTPGYMSPLDRQPGHAVSENGRPTAPGTTTARSDSAQRGAPASALAIAG